ncbi:MAG TPA: hypothetical protein VI731_01200 [Bacteroidia bacterium]|nr:hypothetical protein [Bacteroidia bacterium]
MKKAVIYVMAACLSVMFLPESLRAVDMNAAKTETKTEIPVNSPVDPVSDKNKAERPDPLKAEKKSQQQGNWGRGVLIFLSSVVLLLLVVLLLIMLL